MNPIIILGIGGAFAVILLLIGIIVTIRSERSVVEERLEEIVGDEKQSTYYTTDDDIEDSKARRSILTDWLNRLLQGSNWADGVSKNLAMADLKMKPGEYLALMIISAAGTGAVIYLISGSSIIIGIIGAIIGLFLPRFYVKRSQNQRLQRFDNQLGDMLSLMVNGLRAGYSSAQAMEAVSKEMPPPICDEFRRVVQEMQLGVTMEQALANLLRRIPSDDLDLTITAINVQREVGGNLAEILDTISFTIRERVRIKGEIKTLTTQTTYSGRFLSILPLIVMGVLFLFNRPYMMEFFSPINNFDPSSIGGTMVPCGYCALILSAGLIIMGYFAMMRLADVEV